MITFGGRPLNTYGSESLKTYRGGAQPVVVEVQPNIVKIEPPQSEDSLNPLIGENISPNPSLTPYLKHTHNQLVNLGKELDKAKFKNKLVVKIFSAPVVITCMIIWWILTHVFTLIFIFIIFCICYYLYEITQGLLDGSHKLLDSLSKSLSEMNGWAINIDIGMIHIHHPIFNNALSPWIRDVDRSNNKFPRSATVLGVDIIKKMMMGIVEKLPGMFESFGHAFKQVFNIS